MSDVVLDEPPFVTSQLHSDSDPFRLLVDAVHDYGIFMLDPAGNVSSWNPGAEKSKGYTSDEIIGKHVSCFYTEDDIASGKPELGLQTALAEGRFEEESLRVRKGGDTFWSITTITNIHDSFGQHIGYANVTRDITERKQAESVLRLRDRAIESLIQGLYITDPTLTDNPIIFANESFLRITGYDLQDVLGKNSRLLQGPSSAIESIEQIQSAIHDGESCLVEIMTYRKDTTPFWGSLSISPIRNTDGQVAHFVGVLTDISPLKLMEQQYRQSQKMEAIGQLAGGVAHDFNNLLTIISGYSELLLEALPESDPNRESIKAINDAGSRGAGLTRQLLTFSRHSAMETRVLNLNDVVLEAESMLRRMIGEDVQLTTLLDPNISRVKLDSGLMGQILMNLSINARDAMPHGGNLTIETSDTYLDTSYAATHPDCRPGHYVKLAVSDNGSGMTPAIKAHVFEPFFTTKGQGKGTGLGLATVYGIVKQTGGSLDLYSEVGHGTTFKIYLPAIDEPASSQNVQQRANKIVGGTETIILVEDDYAVRTITSLILTAQGYTVLPAEGGKQALALLETLGDQNIHLLITDVVMPGMSGPKVAEALMEQRPDIKVLYVSGYTDDAVVRHGILAKAVAFIQKPFTPMLLARKVRSVLDEAIGRT